MSKKKKKKRTSRTSCCYTVIRSLPSSTCQIQANYNESDFFVTLAPCSMAITPEAVFAIKAGIRKGSIVRSALYPPPGTSKKPLHEFSSHSTPPMPEPTMTPKRSPSTVLGSNLASASASRAATIAKWVYRPLRLIDLPLRPCFLGSKSTTPANYYKTRVNLECKAARRKKD